MEGTGETNLLSDSGSELQCYNTDGEGDTQKNTKSAKIIDGYSEQQKNGTNNNANMIPH